MKDSIPAGFVMVKTAFERYLLAFGGVDQDGRAFSMLTALSVGTLNALTTNPDNHRQDAIPAALWNEGAFPERVFYEDDIAPSDEWYGYRSRTPYLSEAALSKWISAQLAGQAHIIRRLRSEYWTVDQALNWILWRDENPDNAEIMVRLIASLESGAPRTSTSFDSAKARLMQALRRGEVRSVATNQSDHTIEPVPVAQYATAELQHSTHGHLVKFPVREGDVGLNGGHLNMPRLLADDVVRAFPVCSAPLVPKVDALDAERSKVEFDASETAFPIFRAAQWLALKGRSGLVSLKEVEKAAETILFPALAAATIAADAIEVSSMQPTTVPASRWAFVTTDEAQPGQLLQWINSWWFTLGRKTGDQIGGELTVHEDRATGREVRPTWVQISVPREQLLKLLQPPTRRGRGAVKGQGSADDRQAILRVLQLELEGTPRWNATVSVGAEIAKGKSARSNGLRLWKKTKALPPVTSIEQLQEIMRDFS